MGFKLTNQGSSKRLFFNVSSHYLLSRIPQISHFMKIKQKMYSPEKNGELQTPYNQVLKQKLVVCWHFTTEQPSEITLTVIVQKEQDFSLYFPIKAPSSQGLNQNGIEQPLLERKSCNYYNCSTVVEFSFSAAVQQRQVR